MAPRKAGLGFIFTTLFLDVFGLGLVVPVLPSLIGGFFPSDPPSGDRAYGFFLATYAAMQFTFSPMIGSLSDRFGRRPLLLVSNLGQGLTYLVLASVQSLPLLFLARALSGITGASAGTATAYIADVSPPEKRARNFGLVGVAFGLGFVFGPWLGSRLGESDPRLPFRVAAALALLNAVYGLLVLPESLPPGTWRAFEWRRANPIGSLAVLRQRPGLIGLAMALLLFQMAQRGLESVWVIYGAGRYHWTHRQTGESLVLVGLAAAIVQGGVIRQVMPRLGERRALLAGLVLGTIAMVLYGLADRGWMLLAVLPIGALSALAGPAAQALMSRRMGGDEQGGLQGALTSLQSLTSMLAPLYATHLFAAFGQDGTSPAAAGAVHRAAGELARRSAPYVPGAPFFAGALFVAIALAIAWRTLAKDGEPAVEVREAA